MGEVKQARTQWSAVQSAVTAAIELASRIEGEAGSAAQSALRGASDAVYACAMWDTLSLQATDEEGERAEAVVHELAAKQNATDFVEVYE